MADLRFLIESAMHLRGKELLASMMQDADETTDYILRTSNRVARAAAQDRLAHLSDAIEHVADGDIDSLMTYSFVAIHAATHAAKLAGIAPVVTGDMMAKYYA